MDQKGRTDLRRECLQKLRARVILKSQMVDAITDFAAPDMAGADLQKVRATEKGAS